MAQAVTGATRRRNSSSRRHGCSRTEDSLALLLLLTTLPLLRLGLQDLEKSPNAAILPAHTPKVGERRKEEAVVNRLHSLEDVLAEHLLRRRRSRKPVEVLDR